VTARPALGEGRILVGTDGSERSDTAVEQAARIASLTGSRLDIVFVLDGSHPHEEDVVHEADEALARASELAGGYGAEVSAYIVSGEPAEALVREASEQNVELICVGADATLMERPHRIGRVAAHVLERAEATVLVARGPAPGFPRRVLCAIDGSEGSAVTADAAARIAALGEAEFRALHVIPVFKGGNEEWEVGADEDVPEELQPAMEAARARGVAPRLQMAMGRPEAALVEVAKREEADLLVVGHRGISGMRKRLLGSVSEHVTGHARCSVLVVRPGGAEEG